MSLFPMVNIYLRFTVTLGKVFFLAQMKVISLQRRRNRRLPQQQGGGGWTCAQPQTLINEASTRPIKGYCLEVDKKRLCAKVICKAYIYPYPVWKCFEAICLFLADIYIYIYICKFYIYPYQLILKPVHRPNTCLTPSKAPIWLFS
jgi:hypothetical protein